MLMELVSPMTKTPAARSDARQFANWLRQTVQQLKDGDLPPETWEHQSPFEESGAQRRIAKLIANIAEKPKYKRD